MTDISTRTLSSLPAVSVYIPTRNRARQLANCLRAVLSQEGALLDVIVIDDASDDATPRFIRRLASKGLLRCVLLEKQGGAQAARNIGMSLANGEYITGADDDDVWLPGRVSTMLRVLTNGASFVAATDIMDRGDGRRYLQRRPDVITLDALLRRNVVGNQLMCRTADFRRCGVFDPSLPASQDYDFWIRLAILLGEGRGIHQPLQWVDASAERKRISTSAKRRRGVWMVFRKYRHLMTPEQRKDHVFNMLRTTGRPISWRTVRTLSAGGDTVRLLLHFLRGVWPRVDDIAMTLLAGGEREEIQRALGTCESRRLSMEVHR